MTALPSPHGFAADRPALAGSPSGASEICLAGETLAALPSGALWWPRERTLCVADLHLGRAQRTARHGGALLPPYETEETLARLATEIAAMAPGRVVCLGDSFDDGQAVQDLAAGARAAIADLVEGREWIWITGNHDPAPPRLGGRCLPAIIIGALTFRHIGDPAGPKAARGEVSGHYHPKARLCLRGRRIVRPCFVADGQRLILPAFGTYTGGLDATDPVFGRLLGGSARVWLTGSPVVGLPRSALGG